MTITEAYHKGYNDGLYDGYNSSSIEQGLTKEEYNPPEEQDTCGDAVIEDIKTEIETEMQDCTAQWHDAWWNGRKDGLKDALEIIDRHISGKENKDGSNT